MSSGIGLEQIGHEADVRDLEDRRLRVLVDRDDRARVLDARDVLDRAGDADGDVELRRDDLARLTHLQLVGDEPRVDRRARRADRGAERVGELRRRAESPPRCRARDRRRRRASPSEIRPRAAAAARRATKRV